MILLKNNIDDEEYDDNEEYDGQVAFKAWPLVIDDDDSEELILHKDNIFNCNLNLKNGEKIVIHMRKDGYINATQLCKAKKKKWNNYYRNKKTQEYLEALKNYMVSTKTHNRAIDLIESIIGHYGGTFVHRKVAIHLAQWLDPYFAVQVTNWIEELIKTGKVEIEYAKKLKNNNTSIHIKENIEIEKYKIDSKIKIHAKLFSEGKLTFEQYKELISM